MATPPTWDEWVKQYNSDSAPAPSGGATVGGLSATDLGNINNIFDPNFGRRDAQQDAAQNAVGSGWGGGGFAHNQGLVLTDREKKGNWELGHKMLEPYLAREHDTNINTANNAARLQQIAAEGAAALQRLQLSEAGQTARLNTEQAAALQRQIVAGQQAMQQLTLKEAGDTGRLRESIGGGIASDLIRASISGGGGGGGSSAGPVRSGPGGRVNMELGSTYNPAVPQFGSTVGMKPYGSATPAYNPNAQGIREPAGAGAIGATSIDRILARYGLLG